ncbi:MAG: glycoside hydrolase family 78 protein [Candidatus Helarchaeota archaeon]
MVSKITIKVINLRCEYLINPIGIDITNPRLSWELISDRRGDFQNAYRIIVSDSKDLIEKNEGNLWDTGKIESDIQNQIEYHGMPLKSRMECFWKVMVWDKDNNPSNWSEIAYWEIGLLNSDEWSAKWIGPPKKKIFLNKIRKFLRKRKEDPSPLLRKSFVIDHEIKKAVIYVSALGEYELFLNGKRVGDHFLAPEWTDYDYRVQYQTFIVTNLLERGENIISAILGDGWYIGNIGFITGSRIWGNDRRFLFQMEITFSNDEKRIINSDSSWKIYYDGPIRRSDHYLGEIYDSRKEIPNWNISGFNDSEWKNVVIDDSINVNLVAQMNEPIKIIKELSPTSISEPKPGIFIFDIGQNIAGFCKIIINESICEKDGIIKLRHGEMLKEDGSLYTKNLRFAKATDKFIYNGNGKKEYHPYFTYHGFQYVEVSGLKQGTKLDLNFLKAYVISSSIRKTGAFESSDPMLNKLWKNIFWTQIDNLISVPTDCPQRDERLGWMGDANIFCQTSIFNMDMAAFYTKWIKDIRDAQIEDGRYSDFSPNNFLKMGIKFTLNAPGWADCGVILPWLIFLNYGDKRVIEHHYNSAKRFIDHVYSKNPNLIWKHHTGQAYNDWLNGDTIKSKDYPSKGGKIPKKVFATAFFAYSTNILSKMAKLLGNEDDAIKYSNLSLKIKEIFKKQFVSESGKIEGDTQAGYAIALHFDLLPENLREKAVKNLIKSIEKYDNRISTGFHTTIMMMLELINWGYVELAYKLLQSERFPSWYYMIKNGATTMWERWDGYVKGRGFQSPMMNSFNHYSIGAIGEWIYRIILGINFDEKHPGYKHIIIRPIPYKTLTWAKGYYDSIYGRISVSWSFKNNKFNLELKIPCNTTATIYIPAKNKNSITENGKSIFDSDWIKFIEFKKNWALFEIKSGRYIFESS